MGIISSSDTEIPPVSRFKTPISRIKKRQLVGVLLVLAGWLFAVSLSVHFQWLPGLQNPNCAIEIVDWRAFALALGCGLLGWIVSNYWAPAKPPSDDADYWETRFFSEELKEYFRSHPARLRHLKRAIRRNNVNRVRALIIRGTPTKATEEYLSANELAEIYGNQEIIDLLEASWRVGKVETKATVCDWDGKQYRSHNSNVGKQTSLAREISPDMVKLLETPRDCQPRSR